MHEEVELSQLICYRKRGSELAADALTKALPAQRQYLLGLINFESLGMGTLRMVVLSLVTGVSAQPTERSLAITPFWIWMWVAFLTEMMIAFLLQTLDRVWARVQGWFRRRPVLTAGNHAAVQIGELQVIQYAADLAVLEPSPEGLRRRRDASSSLQNVPMYTEEQVAQIFDT